MLQARFRKNLWKKKKVFFLISASEGEKKKKGLSICSCSKENFGRRISIYVCWTWADVQYTSSQDSADKKSGLHPAGSACRELSHATPGVPAPHLRAMAEANPQEKEGPWASLWRSPRISLPAARAAVPPLSFSLERQQKKMNHTCYLCRCFYKRYSCRQKICWKPNCYCWNTSTS